MKIKRLFNRFGKHMPGSEFAQNDGVMNVKVALKTYCGTLTRGIQAFVEGRKYWADLSENEKQKAAEILDVYNSLQAQEKSLTPDTTEVSESPVATM